MVSERLRTVLGFAGAIVIFAAISIIFVTRQLPVMVYAEVPFDGEEGEQCQAFDAHAQLAQPYLYNVTIVPDVARHRFTGEAVVHFKSSKIVGSLYMHLGRDVTLNGFNHTYIRCNDDEIKITLTEKMSGDFAVAFEFSSPLSNDNHGLYGTKDPVSGCEGVATQFEATHARRVFPCYDTPSSKAVFSLSVFAEAGKIAIANTPVKEKVQMNDGVMYRFEDTPKMSPYLVAFAVGQWDVVTGKTKRDIGVDVYVPVGQSESGKFALKFAAGSIDVFEEMFGVNYPLPRLQLVAIPDFAAGAMENWGLVTFRYQALLAIDGVSSLSALSSVAEVVVHENAHMWAGDLVSPYSWDDLWLNEGFATLLPLFCIPKIDARFDGMIDFHRFEVQEAISFDFSQYTHPIQADVNSTDEAESNFDSITYSKAATVLNMLRLFMGDEKFWQSLGAYFKKYAYGYATSDDLVRSFEETSGLQLAEFTQKWTKEGGFPTVRVSRANGKYVLQQRRLMLDGTEADTILPLPLVRSDTGETVNMNGKTLEIDSQFTTFNDGRLSMCIIEYDTDLENELLDKWDNLSAGAKWMLIEDTKLLVIAFRKPVSALLHVLEKVKGERDQNVIEAAVSAARYLYDIDPSTKTTLCDIFLPFLNMTREANESVLTSRLRVKLLSLLGLHLKNDNVLAQIQSIDISKAPEDVMAVAIMEKGYKEFNYVRNLYRKSTVPQIQVAALSAMGVSEHQSDIETAFDMLLNELKSHEIPTLIASLSTNPHAKGRVSEWIESHIDKLLELFGTGYQMHSIMSIGISSITDSALLDNFMRWVSSHPRLSALRLTVGRQQEYTRAKIKLTKHE